MNIKVDDEFVLHSVDGRDYKIIIANINDYRPPDQRYAIDVYNDQGQYPGDVIFVGDDFFLDNKGKLEKVT